MHLNLLELDERKLYKCLYFFRKTVPENIIQTCSDKHNSKNNYSLLYFVCFCLLIAYAILFFELEN